MSLGGLDSLTTREGLAITYVPDRTRDRLRPGEVEELHNRGDYSFRLPVLEPSQEHESITRSRLTVGAVVPPPPLEKSAAMNRTLI